jgi:hypothetical protein
VFLALRFEISAEKAQISPLMDYANFHAEN